MGAILFAYGEITTFYELELIGMAVRLLQGRWQSAPLDSCALCRLRGEDWVVAYWLHCLNSMRDNIFTTNFTYYFGRSRAHCGVKCYRVVSSFAVN